MINKASHLRPSAAVVNFKKYSFFFLILLVALSLAACGFKLRGASPLPFNSLYTNISSQSAFGIQIIRGIRANSPHTAIVNDPNEAEVRLIQISSRRTRKEMSLDVNGKVEEYELGLYISFTLVDNEGNALLEPTTLSNLRLLPYDENDSAAKAAEMEQLYADMERHIANAMLQRITADDVIHRYRQFH